MFSEVLCLFLPLSLYKFAFISFAREMIYSLSGYAVGPKLQIYQEIYKGKEEKERITPPKVFILREILVSKIFNLYILNRFMFSAPKSIRKTYLHIDLV